MKKSKKNKQKNKLYLTYEDLKLLNDILNYLDEIETKNEYPYAKSVYKEFPNKIEKFEDVPQFRLKNLEEESQFTLKKLEEEPPILKDIFLPDVEEDIPIKETQEKKVDEVVKVITELKKSERDIESIKFIDLIFSKLDDKNKAILDLQKIFNTKDPNIIRYKLQKYYIIADYSKTFLLQFVKSYYDTLKSPDFDNIQNTIFYKNLFNKYKNEIPFITLEVHDPKSSYLKKFLILFLIENNKIYDFKYLDKFIDSVINLKSKVKV